VEEHTGEVAHRFWGSGKDGSSPDGLATVAVIGW
jgi:hypothetical protein